MAKLSDEQEELAKMLDRCVRNYAYSVAILSVVIFGLFVYYKPWWLGLILAVAFFAFARYLGLLIEMFAEATSTIVEAAVGVIMKK